MRTSLILLLVSLGFASCTIGSNADEEYKPNTFKNPAKIKLLDSTVINDHMYYAMGSDAYTNSVTVIHSPNCKCGK